MQEFVQRLGIVWASQSQKRQERLLGERIGQMADHTGNEGVIEKELRALRNRDSYDIAAPRRQLSCGLVRNEIQLLRNFSHFLPSLERRGSIP